MGDRWNIWKLFSLIVCLREMKVTSYNYTIIMCQVVSSTIYFEEIPDCLMSVQNIQFDPKHSVRITVI